MFDEYCSEHVNQYLTKPIEEKNHEKVEFIKHYASGSDVTHASVFYS